MAERRKGGEEASAVDTLSFEQALGELEDIVKRLESGDVELEQSIAIYERGAALKAHCERKLENARLKVEKIVLTAAGEPTTQAASD